MNDLSNTLKKRKVVSLNHFKWKKTIRFAN